MDCLLDTEDEERPLHYVAAYEQEPALAIASLLTLMSSFPCRHSQAVAEAVFGHLCLLVEDERYPACVRDAAAGLMETWGQFAELSGGHVSRIPAQGLH